MAGRAPIPHKCFLLLNHRPFDVSLKHQPQRDVVSAWAAGRDVFVLSGTGTGKSVCFQLPALLAPAPSVVIVVSPLISLMRDQCAHMQQRWCHAAAAAAAAEVHGCDTLRRGVSCCYLGSGQTDLSVTAAALAGEYRLVYACPETLVGMQVPSI
jgi:Werner syndrome ATP-dependent helicase